LGNVRVEIVKSEIASLILRKKSSSNSYPGNQPQPFKMSNLRPEVLSEKTQPTNIGSYLRSVVLSFSKGEPTGKGQVYGPLTGGFQQSKNQFKNSP
jgi:hypothetical protein